MTVHDAFADAAEARAHYDVDLAPDLGALAGFDAVIGAVAHAPYVAFAAADFARLARRGGLVADVKGLWRAQQMPDGIRRWML